MQEFRLVTTYVKMEFKDLIWENNIATVSFKNNYTVRIIKHGPGTTIGAPYTFECIPINSIISDDIIGYCTKNEIIQLLNETERLPKLKD